MNSKEEVTRNICCRQWMQQSYGNLITNGNLIIKMSVKKNEVLKMQRKMQT